MARGQIARKPDDTSPLRAFTPLGMMTITAVLSGCLPGLADADGRRGAGQSSWLSQSRQVSWPRWMTGDSVEKSAVRATRQVMSAKLMTATAP